MRKLRTEFLLVRTQKSERMRVQKNCRESSPRASGACSSFCKMIKMIKMIQICVSTHRVREWVRGRKKERFQSQKVGKDTPYLSYLPTLYNRTKCALPSFSFLAAPRGKKKRARQEIEQSGAPSRFLSLSLRDVASSPVESHDWNSKKIIFDVANGNENGFLCFFFYDDDERQ